MIDGKINENKDYCFDLSNNDSGDAFTDLMVCEFYEIDSSFFYFSVGNENANI